MSWSTSMIGRAGALATRVADDFKNIQGCPVNSPEEAAKNALGDAAAVLCAGYADPNVVVKIDASGSASNNPWQVGSDLKRTHNWLSTKFEISTIGTFVE